MVFEVGFFLQAAIFVNQTYIDPYFQLTSVVKSEILPSSRGSSSPTAQIGHTVSQCLEWVMHLGACLLSALMFGVVVAPDGATCYENGAGVLGMEGHWLQMLAIA